MRKCAKDNMENDSPCQKKDCRLWLNYGDDLNCTMISVKKNGKLTLSEAGERLGISYVRVSQIEKQAVNKLKTVFKI
tara:strand:- start:376 stop:606 length:231 start_codon:yes stop_codon:yes gene_type:complete